MGWTVSTLQGPTYLYNATFEMPLGQLAGRGLHYRAPTTRQSGATKPRVPSPEMSEGEADCLSQTHYWQARL